MRPPPITLLCVALTGLYLALPAREQMNAAAACLVILHIALGLLIVAPVVLYLIRVWRESPSRLLPALLVALSGTSLLTSLILLLRPLLGQNNASATGVWWMHLLSGVAGIALWGVSRKSNSQHDHSTNKPSPVRGGLPTGKRGGSTPALLLFGLPLALWASVDALPYHSANYARDISATNPQQAENPLFPAELRLAEGQSSQEANQRWNEAPPEYCGRAGCHAGSLKDWHVSAHQFAGRDSFYQKVKQVYTNRSEKGAENWCAGCHEPQKALTNAKPALNRGVDCLACHAVTQTAPHTGNGRYTLSIPQTYPFATEKEGWRRSLHEFLIRLRPAPHQSAFAKPLHKSAELCGSCHRQSFCVAQNQFQFVRGADNFGQWRKSEFAGAIGQGVGEKPAAQKTCIECHRSGGNVHSLPGGNTVLPELNGDNEQFERVKSFLKDRLEVDIFAIRHTLAGKPEAWIAPLDTPLQADFLREGETVTLEICVYNKGVGHDFPSGYEDLKAAWLEVVISDANGKRLLQNGIPTSKSDLPPKGSHDYRLFALDRAGNPIVRNNRTEQVTTLYQRTIPAGGSDLARYTFTLPKGVNARYPLHIAAVLRYRPLRPDFMEWVLKGRNGADRNTTFTLAEAASILSIGATPPTTPDPKLTALRFARYGSALIAPLENPELQRALRAFRTAQLLTPNEVVPYLGMANAYLREPALLDAKREFENALQRDANNAPARLGLGTVAMKQGQFAEALQRLKPLIEKYPNDNALFRTLGTTYYQQGDYEQAITAFQRALGIDPDDSKTHFQLKLAYQRLQRLLEAHREDTILQYHTVDGQTATLRLEYLRLHPDMQAQARSLPEHSLLPPQTGRDSGRSR